MKKYLVHVTETVNYSYEVEANSALEAEEKIINGNYEDESTYYLSDSWCSNTKCESEFIGTTDIDV